MNRYITAVSLAASLLVSACTAPGDAPREVHIVDEVDIEAQVVALDASARALTLESPDGARLTVIAGPEVRNFDQLEVGDTITASYTVSLDARRMDEDEPDMEPMVDVAAARAAMGDKPGGGIGAGLTVTVLVKTVDTESHIVTFTDHLGVLHAVEAEREEGRKFIAGLKPGDRVELTYVEATVLTVNQ